jgi:hypothetical protein
MLLLELGAGAEKNNAECIKDKGKRVTWNDPVVTEEWILVKPYRGKNESGKK